MKNRGMLSVSLLLLLFQYVITRVNCFVPYYERYSIASFPSSRRIICSYSLSDKHNDAKLKHDSFLTLVENMTDTNYFFHLLSSNLDWILGNESEYTIFAPTDNAFKAYFNSNHNHLSDQSNSLAFLERHVLAKRLTLMDLKTSAAEVDIFEDIRSVKNVSDNILCYLDLAGSVIVNRFSRIIRGDIEIAYKKNYIVHVIDAVILSVDEAIALPKYLAPPARQSALGAAGSTKAKEYMRNAKRFKRRLRNRRKDELKRRPLNVTLIWFVLQTLLRMFSRRRSSVIDGKAPGDFGFDILGIANSEKRSKLS